MASRAKRLERREIPRPPREKQLSSVPAWALSLCLHVSILVLLGVFWVGKPKGTGGEAERPVGVAVVYQAAGQEDYYLTGDGQSDSNQDAAESALSALPSTEATQTDSALQRESLSDLDTGSVSAGGEAAAATGSVGLGDGGGSLGGSSEVPKVKTSVFGIEGEGTRFLYVFDRSDSMNGYAGKPLRAAKSELLESLGSLGPAHQFQIIFYNDSPLPFGGLGSRGPALLKGNEGDKKAAQRFVRDVVAVGGTVHIEALRMALGLNPDVIFFLTDADDGLIARDVENLHNRASRGGTTIHSIQFGKGAKRGGGGWIEFLASQTGGQYRYIDVTKLTD